VNACVGGAGPRFLTDNDNPLMARNELQQAARTGIRCVLSKVSQGRGCRVSVHLPMSVCGALSGSLCLLS
jgi:hypothetical protein